MNPPRWMSGGSPLSPRVDASASLGYLHGRFLQHLRFSLLWRALVPSMQMDVREAYCDSGFASKVVGAGRVMHDVATGMGT